jgi:hypothetical protein
VDELERQIDAETLPLYLDENGIAQCARLPLEWEIDQEGVLGRITGARKNRLTTNWAMGDALVYGMDLKKGTVVATFDRTTGKYAQTGPRQGGDNHTAVFLGWVEKDGLKGMRVAEQMAGYQGKARIGFIPFKADNPYYSNAGRFNLVKIRKLEVGQ